MRSKKGEGGGHTFSLWHMSLHISLQSIEDCKVASTSVVEEVTSWLPRGSTKVAVLNEEKKRKEK